MLQKSPIFSHIAALLSAILLSLTLGGCGSKTADLTNTELTSIWNSYEYVLEESSVRYTSKWTDLGMQGYDSYRYEFERPDGTENIFIDTFDNKINNIKLQKTGTSVSTYSIHGIHAGDSESKARKRAKSVYHESGEEITVAGYDCTMYGTAGNDKGMMILYYKDGKIDMIALLRNQ